jgi:hypothetical protein
MVLSLAWMAMLLSLPASGATATAPARGPAAPSLVASNRPTASQDCVDDDLDDDDSDDAAANDLDDLTPATPIVAACPLQPPSGRRLPAAAEASTAGKRLGHGRPVDRPP